MKVTVLLNTACHYRCICCSFLLLVVIGTLYHVAAHKNIRYTMSLTLEAIQKQLVEVGWIYITAQLHKDIKTKSGTRISHHVGSVKLILTLNSCNFVDCAHNPSTLPLATLVDQPYAHIQALKPEHKGLLLLEL